MILSIDTTHDTGSLALVDRGRLIEEVSLQPVDGYSETLFLSIEALMKRHAVTFSALAAIAAAQGPGTFTGVRMGLTAAKGLGDALAKPVFGISNLKALATFGDASIRAPFYDARRGAVYAALPDATEHVLPYAEFLALLPPTAQLISFDFVAYPVAHHPFLLAPREIAAAIGQLAYHRFAAGERPDAAVLDATYVRRSDAEAQWTEAS